MVRKDGGVGAAGIKRRKKTRRADAEPEVHYAQGDVQRLFGRFSWGSYSEAGALERQGFFLRQLKRYRGRPWRAPAGLARLFIYVALLVVLVGLTAAIGSWFLR